MANIYVRSTDGSDADNGTTWALAKATAVGVAAIDAAGDVIYFSASHSESTSGAISPGFAGSRTAPQKILCVDDTGDPASPSTLATTAVIQTTGASSSITWNNGNAYTYGLNFKAGSSTNAANINLNGTSGAATFSIFDRCTFELSNSATTSRIRINQDENATILLNNCDVKFGNASQGIELVQRTSVTWNGGAILSGGTSPSSLFPTLGATSPVVRCNALDLSQGASTMHIFTATGSVRAKCVITNSKLPASWSGSLVTGTISGGSRYEMYNCDSGDTNYIMQVTDFAGTITADTAIYLTSGAGNNSGLTSGASAINGISWKMVSSADAEYPLITLDTPEIVAWNETVGSAVTVTVEFLINSATTLYKEDVWMEVQYLGTSGFPLGVLDTDSRLTVLAATATTECDTGTGVANWTGDGAGSKSYKLVSTITPQEKGFIHVVVKLAKASTTIYVDPKLAIA